MDVLKFDSDGMWECVSVCREASEGEWGSMHVYELESIKSTVNVLTLHILRHVIH